MNAERSWGNSGSDSKCEVMRGGAEMQKNLDLDLEGELFLVLGFGLRTERLE